ncbi:MAG: type II toxin-antitoxin system RelE/ParE family toxin [Firmicutes bacterium]|nr:type II toxin-antitoxin system RelE/ParE family toxin [Bacillota bacterium]MCL2771184.1 type II toxin-antitoxin system RelE/ParE family toxin [Bacillota bacterium]
MYEILYYETEAGNSPVKEFEQELIRKHKDAASVALKKYKEELEKHGQNITKKFKRESIKLLQDGIWELRPANIRVLFFFIIEDNKVVFLHAIEKKVDRVPQREIDTAMRRRKEWLQGGAR